MKYGGEKIKYLSQNSNTFQIITMKSKNSIPKSEKFISSYSNISIKKYKKKKITKLIC